MIFLSKKAFEQEMERRTYERDFHIKTDERIYQLEDRIRDLEYKMAALGTWDQINNPSPAHPVYEQAPYWTNPCWKAPEFTCSTNEGEK